MTRADAAFVLGLALGAAVLAGFGAIERRAELLPASDLSGIWAGARAVVVGADPYDPPTWRATAARLGTQPPDTLAYGYPPHVALALVPLALLPFDVAAGVWTASGVILAALGLGALLRARPVGALGAMLLGAALLGSQPALTTVMVSQWSLHLTGALAVAVALREHRPGLALGPAMLAALAKPHLFVIALPALARRPRELAAACIVAAAVLAAGTIAYPQWPAAWSAYVAPTRIADPPRTATLLGLAGELVGHAAVPVGIGATVALAYVVRSSGAGLAGWLALSVLAAPYGWSYDHLLLIVPVALAASAAAPARRAIVAAIGVAILVVLAPLMYALAVDRGRETLSALVPLSVLTLVVLERRVAV